VTLIVALGAWPALADGPESIPHNDVHIEVRASGELRITETIEYDFGANHQHGLLRVIPVRRPIDDSRDRVYPISNLSVTATGAPRLVSRSRSRVQRSGFGSATLTRP